MAAHRPKIPHNMPSDQYHGTVAIQQQAAQHAEASARLLFDDIEPPPEDGYPLPAHVRALAVFYGVQT